VDAPLVHNHRVELARDAGLEDALPHAGRDAHPVVHHGDRAGVTLATRRNEDALSVSVARVPQQLDDDVLRAADVVLGLAPLGLGDLETNIAVAEVLFDLQEGVARNGVDELDQVI